MRRFFDKSIPRNPKDIVLVSNLFKAIKRGLKNYLEIPVQANSNAPIIFQKQIVRMHVFYLALLHFYQNDNKWQLRSDFSRSLTKIASPTLVNEAESFYQKIITRTRNWYTQESKSLSVEISKRRMDEYFANVATELGIDTSEGPQPFSQRAIRWDDYEA